MVRQVWIVTCLTAAAFSQSVPNPSFEDTAVITSFDRRNPEIVFFKTFYKEPIDERHLLLVVRGGAPVPEWKSQPRQLIWEESDLLGIFLMDATNADLVWELAVLPGPKYGAIASIARCDHNSIVLQMNYMDYGLSRPWLKVFFDVGSKGSTGQKWYTPPAVSAIVIVEEAAFFVSESEPRPIVFRLSGEDARRVEGEELERALAHAQTTESRFGRLASGDFGLTLPYDAISPFGPGDGCRCENCPIDTRGRWRLACTQRQAQPVVDTLIEMRRDKQEEYLLPPTSYEEFAAARPERVKHGYTRESASLKDQIGPHQLDGNRLWFAKLFYDGEGLTGVGGLGYFDLQEKQFTLFAPPEIADWSASAILVENDAVWVALVRHPEGAPFSGGLLRFDRTTELAEVFSVPDTIFELKSSGGAILAGTSNGLYVVRPERTVRISIEPDRHGNWQPYSTVMPSVPVQR